VRVTYTPRRSKSWTKCGRNLSSRSSIAKPSIGTRALSPYRGAIFKSIADDSFTTIRSKLHRSHAREHDGNDRQNRDGLCWCRASAEVNRWRGTREELARCAQPTDAIPQAFAADTGVRGPCAHIRHRAARGPSSGLARAPHQFSSPA